MIIWGKQDQVRKYIAFLFLFSLIFYIFQLCTSEGANYFSNLIENCQLILFDDCGHLITNDKPKETAQSILKFWNNHHSFRIKL